MKQHLRLDWIDAILIALGFAVGIEFAILFPNLMVFGSEISIAGVFLVPMLRRAIWGPPKVGEPKEGAIWKFLSMLGLLTVFFSIPVFGSGIVAIQQSKEPMPDFRSEVQEEESEWAKRFQDLDSFLNGVVVPAGTPQEEIDRLTAEKKAQQEKERKLVIEGRIQKREQDFLYQQEERLQEGINVFLWGLGICIIGAILLRLRYPLHTVQHSASEKTGE